jgi:hypothetical protein
MHIIEIAKKIQDKILLLEQGRSKLEAAAIDKSNTIAGYDKSLAITLIRIRAGKPVELEGEIAKDIPTTMAEKVARGICWKERFEMEKAEAMYKATVSKLSSIAAELNGYQSINRYLQHEVQQ